MADRIENVDDYIASRPDDVQPVLLEIRSRIARAAPGSGETMSYQMPTVTVDGKSLMYFAAWKKHIGIYPVPILDDDLESVVKPYRSGQDTVKFPLREPIPYDIIEKLVTVLIQRRRAADEAGL